MKDIVVRIGAACGACAVAAGVAISVTSTHARQAPAVVAKPSLPTTAVTNVHNEELAPAEPAIEKAEPQIKGPAALPTEEQGLPGN